MEVRSKQHNIGFGMINLRRIIPRSKGMLKEADSVRFVEIGERDVFERLKVIPDVFESGCNTSKDRSKTRVYHLFECVNEVQVAGELNAKGHEATIVPRPDDLEGYHPLQESNYDWLGKV